MATVANGDWGLLPRLLFRLVGNFGLAILIVTVPIKQNIVLDSVTLLRY